MPKQGSSSRSMRIQREHDWTQQLGRLCFAKIVPPTGNEFVLYDPGPWKKRIIILGMLRVLNFMSKCDENTWMDYKGLHLPEILIQKLIFELFWIKLMNFYEFWWILMPQKSKQWKLPVDWLCLHSSGFIKFTKNILNEAPSLRQVPELFFWKFFKDSKEKNCWFDNIDLADESGMNKMNVYPEIQHVDYSQFQVSTFSIIIFQLRSTIQFAFSDQK